MFAQGVVHNETRNSSDHFPGEAAFKFGRFENGTISFFIKISADYFFGLILDMQDRHVIAKSVDDPVYRR